jgi:hypothetical protein
MKSYVAFLACIVFCRCGFSAEPNQFVDTVVLTTVVSGLEENLHIETLVIESNRSDSVAWQFRGSKSYSGIVRFSFDQFHRYTNTLAREISDYQLSPRKFPEKFIFTLLSKGEVVSSKAVGEDFFQTQLSSSVVATTALENIREQIQKGFYTYSYLATSFQPEFQTRGWVHEMADQREVSDSLRSDQSDDTKSSQ